MEEQVIQKEEKTFERHDVENSPFSLIVNAKDGKCKITCGMQLMSEREFESTMHAIEYINAKPWELIVSTAAIMAHNIYKINTQNLTNND